MKKHKVIKAKIKHDGRLKAMPFNEQKKRRLINCMVSRSTLALNYR